MFLGVAVTVLCIGAAVVTPVRVNGYRATDRSWNAPVYGSGTLLTDNEWYLYRLLMDYRYKNGLPSIPISPKLSYVAKLHARDLEAYPPSAPCTLHSWSRHGPWSSCCYTEYSSSEGMWIKPAELTTYRGKGFEIVAWTGDLMKPDVAFSLWLDSSEHRSVIINTENWEGYRWRAIGIAISNNYAVVWFGEEPDFTRRYR